MDNHEMTVHWAISCMLRCQPVNVLQSPYRLSSRHSSPRWPFPFCSVLLWSALYHSAPAIDQWH